MQCELMLISESHCHCQPHAMHSLHSRPDVIAGSDATMLCCAPMHPSHSAMMTDKERCLLCCSIRTMRSCTRRTQ